ncbi:MAG: PA14 domain-containing protein [Rhodopirellula sp. JB055]|uniref:PA14 domain-containing protein n=1 Tax=Rhodopirellula sp. JB055 TaxID=3342846 RepID=UPI00370B8410
MRRNPKLVRASHVSCPSFVAGWKSVCMGAAASFAMLVVLALQVSAAESDSLDSVIAENPILSAGQKIYADQCLQCHGEQGVGTEDYYPDPLMGDGSIGELTEIIVDTMPEEDPDLCVGEDAAAVAAYIHHAFYSEAAQIRNRPPRQSLQRLTGTQFRQSLSDLYAHFAGLQETTWERHQKEHGLSVAIYEGKGWKKENRKIERIDPVVDFEFGKEGPGEGVAWDEFHAHWDGGLRVEQTGRYEIVVRSKTSFTMDFGHDSQQLIDNHVQSEGRDEFRRTLLLTGGRIYPLKIDFNQRKRKGETPPASISLSWVPPGGIETIIPASALVPGWNPPAFQLSTTMPPDDSSYGFERGISVDTAWDSAVTDGAIEFANAMRDQLWSDYFRKHRKDKGSREEKLKGFLMDFVTVAHRGNAEEVQPERIVVPAVEAFEDETDIIKSVVLMTLKSPRFLYPSLDADRTVSQQVANRLALVLHDSLPSENRMLTQIKKDQLRTESAIRQAAERIVDDARTRVKLKQMLYHWMELGPEDDLRKDDEKYPGFSKELIADLRTSLDRFLDETVWSETSDFRQLLGADWAFTNQRLAEFYGEAWNPAESMDEKSGEANESESWTRSVRDPNIHVGVLTHPLIMARLSYHSATSPIHRGVFLIRHVMGRTLRPPNEAFSPLSPDLHPDLTTRERVALQTSPESCQICHSRINPLGFALEHFDAVGRFREKDMNKNVDASGSYLTRDDERIEFEGARGLAEVAIANPDTHRAFVTRMFQYFVKQPVASYGAERLDQLTETFRQSDYNVRKLLVEIAVIAASDVLPESDSKKKQPKNNQTAGA